MELLRIEGTPATPKVVFDQRAQMLEISGYSRPENVRDFYMPLLQWLEDYKMTLLRSATQGTDLEPTVFKFKFIYFNSSTAKFIYDIILLLCDMQKNRIPLKIYWHFDEDDDEMREAGEELSDMANLPFFFVETTRN